MKPFVVAAIVALAMAPSCGAKAQTILPDGSVVLGHLNAAPGPSGPPPTFTNCTAVVGSTDMAGECSATATSGVVVAFGKPYLTRPFCTITDSVTATGINLAAGPSTTGFTLGTTASGDKIRWVCIGQPGN